MNHFDDNESDGEKSFLQRNGFAVGVGGIVLVTIAIFAGRNLFSHHSSAPSKTTDFVMVHLPPPPPPPPTPPPPPPPKMEQKMIEQSPVEKDEAKPDEKPPEQPDVGTSIKGNGPDSFGLSGNSGNGTIGGSGHHGSRWGWYASQVQNRITEALRANNHTRNADLRVEVRIWPDVTGRITRAQLVGSTGDSKMDSAIRDEVLNGLQLQEPPPQGMPTPIVLRLTAKRPI
jgi:outer membrane biosynthesis protein TonB